MTTTTTTRPAPLVRGRAIFGPDGLADASIWAVAWPRVWKLRHRRLRSATVGDIRAAVKDMVDELTR